MKYYIHKMHITNLWGYKNYKINFNKYISILIGPNASGKTTIINILFDILTMNTSRLSLVEFESIKLYLKSFEGKEKITIEVTKDIDCISFKVGELDAVFNNDRRVRPSQFSSPRSGTAPTKRRELYRLIRSAVPAVWLPVSRRLPITDEEEGGRRPLHRRPLESVDECLHDLIDKFQAYRLSLNTDLAELRKDFQRHALENILYDKRLDRFSTSPSLGPAPTESDKNQLMQAFRDVGLNNKAIEKRIEEHFNAATEAIDRMNEPESAGIDIDTVLILPLIARTLAMVSFAQELETKREELFKPVSNYIEIVNTYFNDKFISVDDRGEIIIDHSISKQSSISWKHLSSGEKQILILLTQALMSGQNPTVYVADEPELSLHVSWQEKLLKSLSSLAPNSQIIVATHSPDIVSGYGEHVVNLAKL